MRMLLVALAALFPLTDTAATATAGNAPDLAGSHWGWLALGVFIIAYAMVIAEEFTHLRKSKPVVLAAGVLWILVAIAWERAGIAGARDALIHNLLEYAELLLFLLAAKTFVNTMEERKVFAALRSWLIARQLSLRAIFWLTGLLATIALIPDADLFAFVMTESLTFCLEAPNDLSRVHARLDDF